MRTAIAAALLVAVNAGAAGTAWVHSGAPVTGKITVKNEGGLNLELDKTEVHADPSVRGHLIDGNVTSVDKQFLAVGVTQVAGYSAEWMGGETDPNSWGVKVTRKEDNAEAWITFGSVETTDEDSDPVRCGSSEARDIHMVTDVQFAVACRTVYPANKLKFHVGIGSQAGEHDVPVGAYKIGITGATYAQ